MAHIGTSSPQDRGVWATALYAGLRYGELRALRWGAVDLAAGTIGVRESWDPEEGSIAPRRAPRGGRPPFRVSWVSCCAIDALTLVGAPTML